MVKRGLMLVSGAARLRVFSGRVREVEAGDDCVRERGLCTPNPLPAPPLLHNMGTAKVSICRCSCCNCFCCSHSNDYRRRCDEIDRNYSRQSKKGFNYYLTEKVMQAVLFSFLSASSLLISDYQHPESERNYVTVSKIV